MHGNYAKHSVSLASIRNSIPEIFGKAGIFQEFKKQIVNKILEKEMESHIGYEKHSKDEKDSYNRRHGHYDCTVVSAIINSKSFF